MYVSMYVCYSRKILLSMSGHNKKDKLNIFKREKQSYSFLKNYRKYKVNNNNNRT